MPINHYERAFRAWPVLTGRAAERSTITYGELGEKLHIHHRPVRLVLGIIQDLCLAEHKPPLTILVVSKDGKRPGQGFIAWDSSHLEEGYEEVYQYAWSAMPNPFQLAAEGDAPRWRTLPGRSWPARRTRRRSTTRQRAGEWRRSCSGSPCSALTATSAGSAGCHSRPRCRPPTSSPGAGQPQNSAYPRRTGCCCAPLTMRYSTRGFSASQLLARSPADGTRCLGHRWTTADQHAAAELDGKSLRLPADRRLWPAAEALAYREARLQAADRLGARGSWSHSPPERVGRGSGRRAVPAGR